MTEDDEWLPVIDPFTGGYTKGLDANALTDFRRGEGDTIQRFKLAAASPYFNVGGLYWRRNHDKMTTGEAR